MTLSYGIWYSGDLLVLLFADLLRHSPMALSYDTLLWHSPTAFFYGTLLWNYSVTLSRSNRDLPGLVRAF